MLIGAPLLLSAGWSKKKKSTLLQAISDPDYDQRSQWTVSTLAIYKEFADVDTVLRLKGILGRVKYGYSTNVKTIFPEQGLCSAHAS